MPEFTAGNRCTTAAHVLDYYLRAGCRVTTDSNALVSYDKTLNIEAYMLSHRDSTPKYLRATKTFVFSRCAVARPCTTPLYGCKNTARENQDISHEQTKDLQGDSSFLMAEASEYFFEGGASYQPGWRAVGFLCFVIFCR